MLQSISALVHLKAQLRIKAEGKQLFVPRCKHKGMKYDFYASAVSLQVKTFAEIVFVFVFILMSIKFGHALQCQCTCSNLVPVTTVTLNECFVHGVSANCFQEEALH